MSSAHLAPVLWTSAPAQRRGRALGKRGAVMRVLTHGERGEVIVHRGAHPREQVARHHRRG